MASTDNHSAMIALRSLADCSFDYAVLHGLQRILDGEVPSDIDVIVGGDLGANLQELMERLETHGLWPVCVTYYDTHAVGIFTVSLDARRGVQLDVLCDPAGRGKHHLRTECLLEAASGHQGVPELGKVDHDLYLLWKRWYKQDLERLREVRNDLTSSPRRMAEALERIPEIFSAPIDHEMIAVLTGLASHSNPRCRSRPPIWLMLRRYVHRVVYPVGAWVDITGPGAGLVASELAKRYGRVLVRAEAFGRPASRLTAPLWWIRRIGPVLWRRGVVVSSSPHARRPARNATAAVAMSPQAPKTVDQIAAQVTRTLAHRSRRRPTFEP